MRKINGIIQAGGRASRIGLNKAFLDVGGKRIIDRIIGELSSCVDKIVIVANEPEEYRSLGFPVHPDVIPGVGSLGGIYSGLFHSDAEWNFIVACDMPFLSAELVRRLSDRAEGCDIVVERSNVGFEPLAALYARSILPVLRTMIDGGDLAIHRLFGKVRTRVAELDPLFLQRHPHLFFNINTREDWESAQRMAKII
ncbi:MAG: hypothetical protein A2Z34_09675 [Planctomycetes bacterium RBG_16_59_8]|nr:MAG: hypothetical protein A2Z34_09675 [Planctomycetes bacterium RBG_16_59_8]